MLLLTRKPGQAIQVGEDIKIVLAEIKGKQARIGIDAPKEYQIDRDEVKLSRNQKLLSTIQCENCMIDWESF